MNTMWRSGLEIKLKSFVGDVLDFCDKSPEATEKEEETFCAQNEPSCEQEEQRKVVAALTDSEVDVIEQSKLYIYLMLN